MPAKPGELDISVTIHGQKPTESDLKILFAIMENLVAPLEADWDRAAKSSGMKDRRSFMVMYRNFRKKYNLPDPKGTKPTTTVVGSVASMSGDTDGGSGAAEGDTTAVETPVKKTPVSRKKKPAAAAADEGTTTSTPGMANLTMTDTFADNEQPDTPSKSSTTLASGKKRNAAEANSSDDTPAKKKTVSARKPPRMTAKQRRESAATVIAAAKNAVAAAAAQMVMVGSSFSKLGSPPLFGLDPAGATVGASGEAAGDDTTMEGTMEGQEQGEAEDDTAAFI
ncbi:hypothetical protein QBC45DRAFT_326093 [Copromyces sp. CBS 386.78]|nr:hypothetical protein QBC45DRAFT_326093 [Copromyces sp. CBS 386.78]